MDNISSFKRDCFEDVMDSLKQVSMIFLIGPRKCGKTVCLMQLAQELKNAEYVDFKSLDEASGNNIIEKIQRSIETDEDIVYLLDEITYAPTPEQNICQIASLFNVSMVSSTKVVYAGSQSVALSHWANIATAGCRSKKIYVDFLSYSEWLRFRGDIASEKSYIDFLYNSGEFYCFTSLEEYLQGCIDETIYSNNKSYTYIYGNDVDRIGVDVLKNICYTTLFTLHNHVSVAGIFKSRKLQDDICFSFRQVLLGITNDGKKLTDVINEKIMTSFISSYEMVQSEKLETLKQAFLFLFRSELISITPVKSDDTLEIPDVISELSRESNTIDYKSELFKKYNVCIRYPMFYIAILRDVLKEDMPKELPGYIVGAVTECYLRGLLSDRYCFSFHETKMIMR